MWQQRRQRLVRWTAFVAGASIAVLALASWRVADNASGLGADLNVTAVGSTALATSDSRPTAQGTSELKPFLSEAGLQPGGEGAAGTVTVTNVSGEAEAFRVRVEPSTPDLNDLLQVELAVDGKPLYNGTLAGLSDWTQSSFPLDPGANATLWMRAWLPATNDDGFEARVVEVKLEFKP